MSTQALLFNYTFKDEEEKPKKNNLDKRSICFRAKESLESAAKRKADTWSVVPSEV